jgi:hypothetical protein
MKRQTKAAIRNTVKTGGFAVWICIIALCMIFIHFDDENSSNTYTISGVITDVVLHGGRTNVIEFKIDGTQCYYSLADSGWTSREDILGECERLSQSGEIVTALISEDLDFNRLEFNLRVVGIVDEKDDCFSLESHNARQRLNRIAFSIAPTVILLSKIYLQLKILNQEIIIPAKKRNHENSSRQGN